jgi:hypothetical protein
MNNEESLNVLMHACLVGRTDVLKVIGLAQFPCNPSLNICNHTSQNAMTALSSSLGKEPANWFLSTPRSVSLYSSSKLEAHCLLLLSSLFLTLGSSLFTLLRSFLFSHCSKLVALHSSSLFTLTHYLLFILAVCPS